MRLFQRAPRVPEAVLERAGLGRREKVLASGRAEDDRWLLATRDDLVVVGDGTRRLEWGEVYGVHWDQDESRLRLSEVGVFGATRAEHSFVLHEQGLLLQVLRERVQASIIVRRRFVVSGKRGFWVVGRRFHDGSRWSVDFDEGVDPDDPAVAEMVDRALVHTRDEAGQEMGREAGPQAGE